jgi:hypothetical protein
VSFAGLPGNGCVPGVPGEARVWNANLCVKLATLPLKPTMRIVHLNHWKSFVDEIDHLNGWAFRGEVSATWPLMTSLARRLMAYCPDHGLWPLREMRALRIFRRKAHNYLQDEYQLKDDLRSLSLMQHHGAPTRLLDFSKSPYVAAFFALEHASSDAAVYALNTPMLWSAAPRALPALTRDVIDPRVDGHFERYFLPNTNPVIWVGEPAEMDRRLVAQSGLFVIPGRIDLPLEELLDSYDLRTELLTKYVLSIDMRREAMEALYRMNVTYANLFPDLEGLARASAYELEMVWDKLVEDFRQRPTAKPG